MRLAAALLALCAVGIQDVWAEGIPCYDCRNESCPTLKAPPCPGARREGSRPADRRPGRPRTPAPERPSGEPQLRERSEPVPVSPGGLPPADAPTGAAPEVIPAPMPPSSVPAPAPPLSAPAQPPTPTVEAPPQRVSINPPIVSRGYRGAAIGLGVSGLLLATAGGALLAINGSYRECTVDSDITTCQRMLNTWPIGAGLAIAGAAGLGSTIVLFAIAPRRSAHRAALARGLALHR